MEVSQCIVAFLDLCQAGGRFHERAARGFVPCFGEAMVACRTQKENSMRTLPLQRLATVLTLGMAIVGACASVHAAQAETHAHAGPDAVKLQLDAGRKWATDDALRGGMARIRGLVAPQLGAAHAGTLSTTQYAALAGGIEKEVGGIVANCKLDPKADAVLHVVIGEIGAGTDAMAGKTAGVAPAQGLVRVASAVNDYARHFQHPGFALIPVGH
jgi:hypothetical protein